MQKIFDLSKKIAEATWFQTFIILVILAAGVIVGIQTYEISGLKKEMDFVYNRMKKEN